VSIEGKNTELRSALVTTLSEISGIGNVYGRLRHYDQTAQLLDLDDGCGVRDADTGTVYLQAAMTYPTRLSVLQMTDRDRAGWRYGTVLQHDFEALVFRSFQDSADSAGIVMGFFEALYDAIETQAVRDRFDALDARIDPPEIVRIGEAYWGDRLCAQAQISVSCFHLYR